MNKSAHIFIFCLVVAALLQGVWFKMFNIVDSSMWAVQAEYFTTNDPAQFNQYTGYGHPGGPIIQGVSLLHAAFGVPYEKAIFVFLVAINAILIAGISLLCRLISGNHLWWPAALATLSINHLYGFATPPTIVASLAFVFLCAYLAFLFKKEKLEMSEIAGFSALLGFLLATRFDIGLLASAFLLLAIKIKVEWKAWFYAGLGVILAFVVFNPYMWSMPIQHIADLVAKFTMHYEEFDSPANISVLKLVSSSILTFISVILGLSLLGFKKIENMMPKEILYALLSITLIVYAVVMTSSYQAIRYLIPVTLAWETFLAPALIATLSLSKKFANMSGYWATGAIISYYAVVFSLYAWMPIDI